jgi:putative RNA 2'-phosphotransferase
MNNDSRSVTEHAAVSRLLSKILRREPEMAGMRLDSQAWPLLNRSPIARAATSKSGNHPREF